MLFGLDRFHHYTYGREVVMYTDNKPLISIVQKPLFRAPRRLQAILMKMQTYQFDLQYKPGKQIPVVDALSRAPVDRPEITVLERVSNVSFLPL